MTPSVTLVKAAAGALVLALAAPGAPNAPTRTPSSPSATAGAYTITLTPAQTPLSPTVEHIPKSLLAWGFFHESDGADRIAGPSGTIWQGRLQVNAPPYTLPNENKLFPYYSPPMGFQVLPNLPHQLKPSQPPKGK